MPSDSAVKPHGVQRDVRPGLGRVLEALEEMGGAGAVRIGDEQRPAGFHQLREQRRGGLDVGLRVEDVGGEHEVERALAQAADDKQEARCAVFYSRHHCVRVFSPQFYSVNSFPYLPENEN